MINMDIINNMYGGGLDPIIFDNIYECLYDIYRYWEIELVIHDYYNHAKNGNDLVIFVRDERDNSIYEMQANFKDTNTNTTWTYRNIQIMDIRFAPMETNP